MSAIIVMVPAVNLGKLIVMKQGMDNKMFTLRI